MTQAIKNTELVYLFLLCRYVLYPRVNSLFFIQMFARIKLIKNKDLTGLSSFGSQYVPGGKVSSSPCCAIAPSPCCAIVPSLTLQINESTLWILKPFQYVIKLMILSFVLMLLLCQFETGKQSLSIYWKHCSSTGKKENRGKNPDINLVLEEKHRLPCSGSRFSHMYTELSPCHCEIFTYVSHPKM